jgi:hypothetical protein
LGGAVSSRLWGTGVVDISILKRLKEYLSKTYDLFSSFSLLVLPKS